MCSYRHLHFHPQVSNLPWFSWPLNTLLRVGTCLLALSFFVDIFPRSSVTCLIPSFSPLSHRPFELRPPSAGITAPHQWSSLTPRISTTINCEFSSHPSSRQRIHLIYYHSLHCFNHNRWWNSVDTSNMGSDVRLVHLIHPWYASQPIAAILDWPCLIWHRIPVYGGTSSLRCLIIFVRSSLWFSVWVSAFSIVPAHSRPFSFRFTFSYMWYPCVLNFSEPLRSLLPCQGLNRADMTPYIRYSSFWECSEHSRHTQRFLILAYSWAHCPSSPKFIPVIMLLRVDGALHWLVL